MYLCHYDVPSPTHTHPHTRTHLSHIIKADPYVQYTVQLPFLSPREREREKDTFMGSVRVCERTDCGKKCFYLGPYAMGLSSFWTGVGGGVL